MAKTPFSSEKRRKELEKKSKKEAKKQRKLDNATKPADGDEPEVASPPPTAVEG